MDSEILATNILNSLINKNVKDVSKYLVFPNSDKITNAVRKQLNNLSTNELKSIQLFLKVSPGNSYDLLIRSWTLAFSLIAKHLMIFKIYIIMIGQRQKLLD